MKQNLKIAVIGGTGKSGKYLVNQLLDQGYNFKILVRNPKSFTIKSPLVEVIHGDVADYETVKLLLTGCNTIVSK